MTLEADAGLDRVDRYERLLRYVWRRGTNLNLELVRRGTATVYLYGGGRGRYAGRLLAAAREARAAKRGLWGACRVVWDPYAPATTSPRTQSRRRGAAIPPARPVDSPPSPDLR
ncbi:MAG: thermonuclease family protein [Gaiellaceae bacterium]